MTTYREILDPHQTLPTVGLEPIDSREFSYFTREKFNIVDEDETFGALTLVSEIHDDRKFAHFDGIEIAEPYRGRGIGLAAYILAIEMSHAAGYDFESQNSFLTKQSTKVWEHLAANAIAEVVEPFKELEVRPGKFMGKYRVPVGK